MKVAFLLNIRLDRENSGPSVHLMCSIIRACAAAGDEVCVVSRSSASGDGTMFAELKSEYRIGYVTVGEASENKTNLLKRYAEEARYFRQASKALSSFGPVDAVFVQSCTNPLPAVSAARKACPGARIVYNVQDIYPEAAICRGAVSRTSLAFRLVNMLQTSAYRRSDHIVTISEDMKRTIERSGIVAEKVTVAHNWAYSDEPFAGTPRSKNPFLLEHGLDPDKFYAVYAGNVGTLQDVAVVVEAARLLAERDDIRFLIVGDGTDAARIDGLIEGYGLGNVDRLGRQPSEVAPYIYAMAGLNFITLKRGMTRAALPSKTAICLSCGRPIVLSADPESEYARIMGGLPNCEVVPPDDAEAMKKAVLHIADTESQLDPVPARELFAAEFSCAKNVARYLEALHCAVGSS